MDRQRVFSGAPWEKRIGYCRALRVGAHVYVTGTASVADDGAVHAPGDPYAQAQRCLVIIARALEGVGATLADVVRTRTYVTRIEHWEAVGKAHQEVFAEFPPATTLVGVSQLIHPELLVEIEADAVLRD